MCVPGGRHESASRRRARLYHADVSASNELAVYMSMQCKMMQGERESSVNIYRERVGHALITSFNLVVLITGLRPCFPADIVLRTLFISPSMTGHAATSS